MAFSSHPRLVPVESWTGTWSSRNEEVIGDILSLYRKFQGNLSNNNFSNL